MTADAAGDPGMFCDILDGGTFFGVGCQHLLYYRVSPMNMIIRSLPCIHRDGANSMQPIVAIIRINRHVLSRVVSLHRWFFRRFLTFDRTVTNVDDSISSRRDLRAVRNDHERHVLVLLQRLE